MDCCQSLLYTIKEFASCWLLMKSQTKEPDKILLLKFHQLSCLDLMCKKSIVPCSCRATKRSGEAQGQKLKRRGPFNSVICLNFHLNFCALGHIAPPAPASRRCAQADRINNMTWQKPCYYHHHQYTRTNNYERHH